MTVVYPVWGSEDGLLVVASSIPKALKAARDYMGVGPKKLVSGSTPVTVELLRTFFRSSHMRSMIMYRKGEGARGLASAHVKITVAELNTWVGGEAL